ncbi:MAG: hypothetical protein KDM91_01710 [Verrucomicrobiae bacterium]|nr:hypothetical protein [Verrucomicrobiae bacterium]
MSTKQLSAVAVFAAVFGLVGLANGQQVQVKKVDVKKVEVKVQKTPNFQAGDVDGKKVPNPRDWLEVEVEFEADAAPRDEVVPTLLFRYYVAIQDKDGNTKVLTGDVNHINVIPGEEMYSAVYVAPATLGKITGDFRRFSEGAIKSVAVEVFYNGVSVGGESTAGSGRWWEQLNPEPGVLAKNKTPFAILWLDRYADIQADGR